ncbi:TetR/AcrR family transcriptional regulator [Actinokineospora bangkokensis]|uniref:TetR family transcriptional regulator n=1 Tax=Actinokineospora bangkokensis TaxID=1193682 RepID=A0A1Q9LKH9_9PSEU|nr:TetR/AcrR family transcriptional regulator [Actinokineospora bangkokensis]OLR92495.1 TetR family transcriptional regulator [Actinokineospora bangkokensis]
MSQRPAKERMIEAAFALFEERGYDQTTVDDITERAQVGRTTFFRTFRSKEDVIFPDRDTLLGAIEARLGGSSHETALTAVVDAARLVLRHYLAEGDLALARYRLTRSVPALRSREFAGMQHFQRIFREFIVSWMGGAPDSALKAELMAAAVVTAHNHVLRRWLRGLTERPEQEFDAAMATTVDLFTAPSAAGPEGGIVVFRTSKDLDAVVPALKRVLGEPV